MTQATAPRTSATTAFMFAVMVVGCAPSTPTTESHDHAVVELRRNGRFDEALAAARTDLVRQSRAHGVPAWRVVNARLDVATLERIVALPDSARQQLAVVERLVPARVGAQDDWRMLLPALERQLEVRSRLLGADHPDVADTRSAIGRLEWGLGDAAAAHAQSRRALEVRRRAFGERHPAVVESYDQLGMAVKLAGLRPQYGDSLYARALELGRVVYPAGSPELATAVLHAANFARFRGRREQSDRLFREALRLRRATSPESSAAVAEVLSDWSVTLAYFGDDARAVPLAREALAILDRPGAVASPALTVALNTYGRSLLNSGQAAAAVPVLRRTAEVQELRWRAARADLGRFQMFALTGWIDGASALLALGDSVGAFEWLSRGLARGIQERAMERGELDPADPWSGALERVRAALPDTTALIGWLETPANDMVGDPFWCWVVRRDSGIHWVRVKRPRHVAFGAHRPPAGWQSAADMSLSWLRARLSAAGAWPVRVQVDAETDSLATALWELRIAPIEPWLEGIHELVVVSPDVHRNLPIELLHAPHGPTLLDRFVVSYVPSAVLYARSHVERSAPEDPRRWRALVVGATDQRPGAGGRRSLAQVVAEVGDVRRHFREAVVLLGAHASEAGVRRLAREHQLERFEVIHFGGHQRTDPVFVQDTGIVLAEAYERSPAALTELVDTEDGRLTPNEIDALHLGARLVVLASCNSLGRRYTRTEGTVGLGAAMLRAGARSVLVSLWNVDDRATHLMVERFYRELAPEVGPSRTSAQALRTARLAVRDWRSPDGSRPFAHPSYWAGFVLLGTVQ